MSRPDTPLTSMHITNAFHPTSGGVRTVLRTLLRAGNSVGRRVILVVPGRRALVEDVGPLGRIYYVPATPAWFIDARYRIVMPWRYLLPAVEGIRQILAAEQPDIVDICDKHSLFYVAGLLRKGWISGVSRPTLIGTSAERFDDGVMMYVSDAARGRTFARWYMRAIYAPMFDFHVANSEYTADELRQALPEHRQHVIRVIHPCLPSAAFDTPTVGSSREALLGMTGGGQRTRLLAYVGRLSREKNLDLLVEMLARLVDSETSDGERYHLLIAGDGAERERLLAARERTRGRLLLLGNLPGPVAVRHLLASVDVFVHPNPREPFGLGPLEALAAGVPVVAPNRGGVLSYADSTTAHIVEPTPDAFAAAVRDVIAWPAAARARSVAGQRRASEFDERLAGPRYLEMLDAMHRQRLESHAVTTPDAVAGAVAGATTCR